MFTDNFSTGYLYICLGKKHGFGFSLWIEFGKFKCCLLRTWFLKIWRLVFSALILIFYFNYIYVKLRKKLWRLWILPAPIWLNTFLFLAFKWGKLIYIYSRHMTYSYRCGITTYTFLISSPFFSNNEKSKTVLSWQYSSIQYTIIYCSYHYIYIRYLEKFCSLWEI